MPLLSSVFPFNVKEPAAIFNKGKSKKPHSTNCSPPDNTGRSRNRLRELLLFFLSMCLASKRSCLMKSSIGLNMPYSSLTAPSLAFDMMVNILV